MTLNSNFYFEAYLGLELFEAYPDRKDHFMVQVTAMAIEAWGSEDNAREFMAKPHPMLDDRTPFEASLSEIGVREVEDILGRLLFGSAA